MEDQDMTKTPPRTGDIVRVTIEGPAVGDWPDLDIRAGERIRIVPEDKVTVEVIEVARPAFEDGDVIQVTRGPEWVGVRRGGEWFWTIPGSDSWDDDTTAEHIESGYYTPIRVGGKSSAAQS